MNRVLLWSILISSIIILTISTIVPATNSASHETLPFFEATIPDAQDIGDIDKPGVFYLITVDRLTLQDINENRELFNVLRSGVLGLISSGVEGSISPENTFLSIGAGAPANASGTVEHGVNARDLINGIPASDIYLQRTGLVTRSDSVLQLDIAKIKKLNAENKYSSIPGYLGTLLQSSGFNVEVLGNSDIIAEPARPAVGLAMNKEGFVAGGDVGSRTLLEDHTFPGGLRTNYDRLLDLATRSKNKTGLTVVELGDLERLERMGGYLEDSVIQTQRQKTIKEITAFISDFLDHVNLQHDMVMIISPTPKGNYLPSTNYLTPVVVWGPGTKPGLLTSPTTKRPGIVRNTDLAPTILHYFGIPVPEQMYGRCLQIIPGNNAGTLASLSALYTGLELNYEARPPVLRNYVLIQLVLVFLSLAAIFLPRGNSLILVLKPLLLAVMAFPIALLMVTLLPHYSVAVLVIQLIAITAAIIAIIHLWLKDSDNNLTPFIIISLFTSLCIVFDLLLGSPMQKNSLLGYDPIVGARFYGIGNEYMGVFIGSTIIGTTALVDHLLKNNKRALLLIGAYYLLVLYLIAAPQFGTNVGGSIAGMVSFLVTLLLLAGVRFNIKTIFKLATAVGLLLLTLIFYDLHRPVEYQSHIGRTANLILKSGPGEITNIITRKVNMNIKLLRYTIWSRIFLASLASLAILFYRPVGIMQSIKSRYPYIYKGFIGVVTASIMAFLFNDSGVVAAATTMIFGVPPLLYLVIRTLRTEHVK